MKPIFPFRIHPAGGALLALLYLAAAGIPAAETPSSTQSSSHSSYGSNHSRTTVVTPGAAGSQISILQSGDTSGTLSVNRGTAAVNGVPAAAGVTVVVNGETVFTSSTRTNSAAPGRLQDPLQLIPPAPAGQGATTRIYSTASGLEDRGDRYEVRIKIPDNASADSRIEVENGQLKISSRHGTQGGTGGAKEYSSSSISQSVSLPPDADDKRVRSEQKDGVLTVTVPKKKAGGK